MMERGVTGTLEDRISMVQFLSRVHPGVRPGLDAETSYFCASFLSQHSPTLSPSLCFSRELDLVNHLYKVSSFGFCFQPTPAMNVNSI